MIKHFPLTVNNHDHLIRTFGAGYEFLSLIENKLSVKLGIKENVLIVMEHDEYFNGTFFRQYLEHLIYQSELHALNAEDFDHLSWHLQLPKKFALTHCFKTKTKSQDIFVSKVEQHDLVLCNGPAGTGKTFLAVALAVSMLKQQQFSKLVFARPVVEAGEQLGFLPGDVNEKINPYMQPIFDVLKRFFKPEELDELLASNTIEIAPIAYMRGRTFSHAFIVMDEVQNMTKDQLIMCVSRMGHHSKLILCGDLSQCDLHRNVTSGFKIALDCLTNHPKIGLHSFTYNDIMRHSLVADCLRLLSENNV